MRYTKSRLVLDHLKCVQVWWGHLGEPDGRSIVKDGTHNGLISGQQGFGHDASVRPRLGFHDVKSPRIPLDTIAVVRAKGEVGVQSGTLDFRDPVQRDHRQHRFALEGGVGTGGCQRWSVPRWISGKQWPVACHLPTSPKRSTVGLPSPRPLRYWEQRLAAWNHQRRASCLHRKLGSVTQSGWKRLWRCLILAWPGGKESDAADWGTSPVWRLGMPQLTSPNCVGVGSGGSSRWWCGKRPCQTPSRCLPLCLQFC